MKTANTRVEIKIPGRKGPFYLRRMGLKEVMDYFKEVQPLAEEERIKALVQRTLVNGTSKPVYTDRSKIEDDMSGAAIIMLGMKSQEVSELNRLAELDDKIEEARKN